MSGLMLSDSDEETFFSDYLQKSSLILSPDAYQQIYKDPSEMIIIITEEQIMIISIWEFSTDIKTIMGRKETHLLPLCQRSHIPLPDQHARHGRY